MNNIKILIDDSEVIDKKLVYKYNIDLIPNENLSIEKYISIFQKYNDDIMYFSPSKRMFYNYQLALEAKKKLRQSNINVIDTKNCLMGINLMLVYVNELCSNYDDKDILLHKINKLCDKLDTKFLLDSLSNVDDVIGANIGNINNKCCVSGKISSKDIVLSCIDKNMNTAFNMLFQVLKHNIQKFDNSIIYGSVSKNMYNNTKEKIENLKYFKNIILSQSTKKDYNSVGLSLIKR